jgi:hypothetical protein
MNYARPQAITGVTSSVTGYAHEPRKHFGINGALRNIGNVYRVKMRIDVGASTLQNSEPRENIFGTGPQFSNGKNSGEKNRAYFEGRETATALLHFPGLQKSAGRTFVSKQTVASARVAVLSRMPRWPTRAWKNHYRKQPLKAAAESKGAWESF